MELYKSIGNEAGYPLLYGIIFTQSLQNVAP